jgi:MFS family permease
VALAALASVLAEACFIMAGSVGLIFAGRFINGCAIGLLSGPAVAAITELNPQGDRKRGAWLGALTTVTAIAFGPLLAALLVRFPPVAVMKSTFPFLVHTRSEQCAQPLSYRRPLNFARYRQRLDGVSGGNQIPLRA